MQLKKCRYKQPFIFAVQYDEDDRNIYDLLYDKFTDLEFLEGFFKRHESKIDDWAQKNYGYPRSEAKEYAYSANDFMIDLDEDLEKICGEIREGKRDNFEGFFFPHSREDKREMPEGGGGSTVYDEEFYLPVKCWGPKLPCLVRIYAIELSLRCYIVFYGGFKLGESTQNCPAFDIEGEDKCMESELRDRFKLVCRFLKENTILDDQGLLQYMEEDREEEKK